MDPSTTASASIEDIKPTRILEDPSDLTGKTRHSLWYHDGSIVLLAENHVFKVYEGILADKSPIFKDMFSMPPPVEPEEYEGCKLVRLPDKALDVYYFLKALHDYESFFQSTTMQKFPAMAALLRLGTKYEVQGLRRRAISLFLTCYPTTLEDHATRRFVENDCEALRLAIDLDLTYMLPSLYYECAARLLLSEISRSPHLSSEEKDQCFEFRDVCSEQLLSMRCDLLTAPPLGCPLQCGKKAMAAVREIMCAEITFPDPLSQTGADDGGWTSFVDLACKDCVGSAKRSLDEIKRDFWAELPELLKLPDWGVLLDQQKRDLDENAGMFQMA